MIKRLRKKHGEQFTDDVMETFGIPTNLMEEYYKNLKNFNFGSK
jgi:predicted solute-binding protein